VKGQVEIRILPHQLDDTQILEQAIRQKISWPKSKPLYYKIHKRSIDARGKQAVYQLAVQYDDAAFPQEQFEQVFNNVSNAPEVHIIGCGPAGMFAALEAIELGLKPVIFERGKAVKERRRDLAAINKELMINPESNYCFGEGGAGTYSDGKLYTRSNKRGDIHKVLNSFIFFGATPDIAINARPHIGTNVLPGIIEKIREFILKAGGEIHFNAKLLNIAIESDTIKKIKINEDWIKINHLILATGHSAKDVYELLHQHTIELEAKPFALGVRIEHPQHIIDQIQYKCTTRPNTLPPSYYSLVTQTNQNAVFSFCMCPGGIIAPCATEAEQVVVNGWSPSKRNNYYANSGMVAEVKINQVKGADKNPLAMLEFQHQIENAAFKMSNSIQAPAQRMIDFVQNKQSLNDIQTSYLPGVQSHHIKDVLPSFITDSLKQAFLIWKEKFKGYYTNEAVLVGVESRTSSPIRIPRNESLQHIRIKNLYPCAEGAGYAGGIVSAAIDGQNCIQSIKQHGK
jgi:uncharacterized protein